MAERKYSASEMIDALRKARGVKLDAAEILGCHRNTVDNYINEYVTVQAAYDELREAIVDRAESKMLGKLDDGEWPTIRYVLSTLGKNRGYTERKEVTGVDGGAVNVNFVPAEPSDGDVEDDE